MPVVALTGAMAAGYRGGNTVEGILPSKSITSAGEYWSGALSNGAVGPLPSRRLCAIPRWEAESGP